MKNRELIPIEKIDRVILYLRGHRVMIDSDLAGIYGVTTKQLNQAVKRNHNRFPNTFMFQLNKKEKREVVTVCDHLSHLKFSHFLPYAFTEHGALMLVTVLNSPIAIRASIHVVKAFIRFRKYLSRHKNLARRLDELEQKYDSHFKVVFDAIRRLMAPPRTPKKKLGFRPSEQIGSRSQSVTLKGGHKLRPHLKGETKSN